jgi:hypothetical protein
MALLKVFLVIFYVVHWTACLFFYIGEIESFLGQPTWVTNFNIFELEPFD